MGIPKWGLVPQGQWHLLEPPVIWGHEDTPQPSECQGVHHRSIRLCGLGKCGCLWVVCHGAGPPGW